MEKLHYGLKSASDGLVGVKQLRCFERFIENGIFEEIATLVGKRRLDKHEFAQLLGKFEFDLETASSASKRAKRLEELLHLQPQDKLKVLNTSSHDEIISYDPATDTGSVPVAPSMGHSQSSIFAFGKGPRPWIERVAVDFPLIRIIARQGTCLCESESGLHRVYFDEKDATPWERWEPPLKLSRGCIHPITRLNTAKVRNITFTDRFAFSTRKGKLYSWGDSSFGVLGHRPPETRASESAVSRGVGGPTEKSFHAIPAKHFLSSEARFLAASALLHWLAKLQIQANSEESGDKLAAQQRKNDAWNVWERCQRSAGPRLVAAVTGFAVEVACGESHTVVRLNDGSLSVFGEHSDGRLGLGDPCLQTQGHACYLDKRELEIALPTPLRLPFSVQSISAGRDFTCAVIRGGRVYSWGCNLHGSLGHPGLDWCGIPRLIEGLCRVTKLVCGARHSVVLTQDSKVITWGLNWSGQLGRLAADGVARSESLPREVMVDGSPILAADVFVGERTSGAVNMARKRLWLWGEMALREEDGSLEVSSSLLPVEAPVLKHSVICEKRVEKERLLEWELKKGEWKELQARKEMDKRERRNSMDGGFLEGPIHEGETFLAGPPRLPRLHARCSILDVGLCSCGMVVGFGLEGEGE